MTKWLIGFLMFWIFNLQACAGNVTDPGPGRVRESGSDSFLFRCDSVEKLYIPALYKWMRNSKKFVSVDTVIKTLDSIEYEKKIERIRSFCKSRQIEGVELQNFSLALDLVKHIFFDSNVSHLVSLEKDTEVPEYQHSMRYNNKTMIYDPIENHPELSWAFEHRQENRKIFISKTREAPLQWQETCLSEGVNGSVEFDDCFASDKTQFTLNFDRETFDFQIRHGESCLSKSDALRWVPCNKGDRLQYFRREAPLNNKAGSYLKYQLRHLASKKMIFEDEYLHIRDAFPLLPINKPISYRRTSDQIDSFLEKRVFHAEKKPNIFIIWLDTVRADAITPTTAPNLYNFAKESISFEQNFASGTSTRPTGYAVWNSRPATEWAYSLRHEYNRKVSINPKILDRLGYKINVIGGEMGPIDEKVFDGNGKIFDEQNPMARHVFHRELFDFRKPKDERLVDPACLLTDEEYQRHTPVENDQKSADCLAHQLEKKDSNPSAYFLWSFGAHTPYLTSPNLSKTLRYPSFVPYSEDSYLSVKKPLWNMWYWGSVADNREALINSYLNIVSSVDQLFSRMIATLKKEGFYDDSIIVVMSDHGESLFENSTIGHGGAGHQKVIESFIYYHFPKGYAVPEVRTKVGSHADIFPTIFDTMGLTVESPDHRKLDYLHIGNSIFKTADECKISVQPNGYGFQAIEFSIYNGEEKLRARFRNKEREFTTNYPEENPLNSTEIEVIAYTDYWDRPLRTSENENLVKETLETNFGHCFTRFFGVRTELP